MVLQAKVLVDCEDFMRNKEAVATKRLIRENNKRIDHIYHIDDYVMIKLDRTEQKEKINAPYTGPYRILKICANGMVKINRGVHKENINICRLKPYEKEND